MNKTGQILTKSCPVFVYKFDCQYFGSSKLEDFFEVFNDDALLVLLLILIDKLGGSLIC